MTCGAIPHGSFLAAKAAEPVYALLGVPTSLPPTMPAVEPPDARRRASASTFGPARTT